MHIDIMGTARKKEKQGKARETRENNDNDAQQADIATYRLIAGEAYGTPQAVPTQTRHAGSSLSLF
jgi:hypothetical protein